MKLTWERALSIYIDSLENGNEAQKVIAREEIMRLGIEMDKLQGKQVTTK